MTLDELKSLRKGEVVVITKAITEFHNYQVNDELTFISIGNLLTHEQYGSEIVKFVRKLTDEEESDNPNAIGIHVHFSYDFCHYIETKVILEREQKLNNLGI
jgi:hypothetical protein